MIAKLFFDPPVSGVALDVICVVAMMFGLAGLAIVIIERFRRINDTNLRQRYFSSFVLAAVVITFSYIGGIPFALFVGIISAGCIKEFMNLVHVEALAYRLIGQISGIFFIAAAFIESSKALHDLNFLKSSYIEVSHFGVLPEAHNLHPFYILPILLIMIILVVPLILQQYQGMSVRESFTIFGILYFGWFLAHLVFIRNHSAGFGYAMFLCMLVVWNDVFAYAIGRIAGKIKMVPLISPKKTREGAIGGFIGSIVASLLFRSLITGLTLKIALFIGILAGISAPLGDLVVSVMKRDVGVKDSGNLIPGHGGLLDRCGSFTFTIPVFYYCLRILGF